MADDIINNEGVDEAGDAGMPDDLKRLLARAEQGEDGDPNSYNPDAEDEEDEDDDAELEESFGAVDRGASAGEDINGGQLQISEFGREMKQSFIEYSMSVITARALLSTGKQALQIVGHAGIAGLAHTLVIVDIVCHVTSSWFAWSISSPPRRRITGNTG